jgi:hypothetical protein
MLTTVEGEYRKGVVRLLETPEGALEGRVLVTFLDGPPSKSQHKPMVFGQFAGETLPTEEDFKLAEWHGEGKKV